MTAAWPTFEAALVEREMVAGRTMTFRWRKPASWNYRAYIAGPAGMVQGLRTMLLDASVAEDDIWTEEFTGY